MSPEERWFKWGIYTPLRDAIKEGSVEKVAALLDAGEGNRAGLVALDGLAAMALGLTEQDKASLSDEARAAFDAVRLAAAPFFPRSCSLLVCSSSLSVHRLGHATRAFQPIRLLPYLPAPPFPC